jgi:hypothetical protein
MDYIEKHYPPVVGEYAYYMTPMSQRQHNYNQYTQSSNELRWIVTVNNDSKIQSVLCHWSSNVLQESIPFQTCNGIIVSVDKSLGSKLEFAMD